MADKLTLLPYQLDFLRHAGSSITLKSRQIGYSYASALKHVLRACGSKKRDTYYSATDETQAKNWISYCRELALKFDIPLEEDSSQKLAFPNGSVIIGLSSNPKTIHGKSADIVIDEAALHEEFDELLKAAIPCQTWGYSVDILSTISTPNHGFYQLYCDVINGGQFSSKFRAFKVDLYDAVRAGLARRIHEAKHGTQPADPVACDKEFVDEIRNGCSTAIFNSQYLCLPGDSSSFIVPVSLYKELAVQKAPNFLGEGLGDELYAGIDVGRSKNFTVLWVISKHKKDSKNHYRTACVYYMQDVDITEQVRRLKDILKGKGVKKIAVDQGLFGITIVDELKKEFGSVVVPTTFTPKYKAESAELLRRVVEFKTIELPTDTLIQQDLCSLSQSTTKNGTVSYGGAVGDSHCDFAWALAMALFEAEKNKPLAFAIARM